MLNEDERHAGRRGQRIEQRLDRFEAAGGGADGDDGKIYASAREQRARNPSSRFRHLWMGTTLGHIADLFVER